MAAEPEPPSGPQGTGCVAFTKGGCGCLAAVFAGGLLLALVGGRFHIDLGGIILVFAVGGVIGLVFFSIYKKGYREGHAEGAAPPPHHAPWSCSYCGQKNPAAERTCSNCSNQR
jgi:hypothetical protein